MQHGSYRRSKMGCLPGDVGKRYKIAMLEKDLPIVVHPWHIIDAAGAKPYRKEKHRIFNRRFRHGMNKMVQEQLG